MLNLLMFFNFFKQKFAHVDDPPEVAPITADTIILRSIAAITPTHVPNVIAPLVPEQMTPTPAIVLR